MRSRHKLLSISRWLGTFPSLGYALIYLSLIPIFAFIFYSLPLHFYHSTVQYESLVVSKYKFIDRQLEQVIVGDFKKTYHLSDMPEESIKVGQWYVFVYTLNNLKLENNQGSFDLSVEIKHDVKNNPGKKPPFPDPGSFPLNVHFRLNPPNNDKNSVESKFLELEFRTESELLKDEKMRVAIIKTIFPNGRYMSDDFVEFDIPTWLAEEMRNFASGNKGFGSSVEGNFVRMLYLSSVTITTLGYGDIVPITTVSRILISIESILGIVLIGLFLNALSYERAAMEELTQIEQIQKIEIESVKPQMNGAILTDLQKEDSSKDK